MSKPSGSLAIKQSIREWVGDNLEETRHALAAIDRKLKTFDDATLESMQVHMRAIVDLSQKKRARP